MQSPWPVVRNALRRRQLRQLSDHELLALFLDEREEEAFGAVVGRHGPMVLGVCRRVLLHAQDAEDAFQAVFLVLMRKAASIAKRDALSAWLYGVAYRIAIRARMMNARRRNKEGELGMARSETNHTPTWNDLEPLLDQEVTRLPKKYQVPLVLCELEGKSRKDAARLLGLPEGTLSSRLARARELLRERIRRRGVAISASSLSALLLQNATAAVPPALARGALKAALSFELGMATAGTLSVKVTALAQSGLKSFLLQKIALTVMPVLLLGMTIGGTFLWAGRSGGSPFDQSVAAVSVAQTDSEEDREAADDEEEGAWTEFCAPNDEWAAAPEELPSPAVLHGGTCRPRSCKGPWRWRSWHLGAAR